MLTFETIKVIPYGEMEKACYRGEVPKAFEETTMEYMDWKIEDAFRWVTTPNFKSSYFDDHYKRIAVYVEDSEVQQYIDKVIDRIWRVTWDDYCDFASKHSHDSYSRQENRKKAVQNLKEMELEFKRCLRVYIPNELKNGKFSFKYLFLSHQEEIERRREEKIEAEMAWDSLKTSEKLSIKLLNSGKKKPNTLIDGWIVLFVILFFEGFFPDRVIGWMWTILIFLVWRYHEIDKVN